MANCWIMHPWCPTQEFLVLDWLTGRHACCYQQSAWACLSWLWHEANNFSSYHFLDYMKTMQGKVKSYSQSCKCCPRWPYLQLVTTSLPHNAIHLMIQHHDFCVYYQRKWFNGLFLFCYFYNNLTPHIFGILCVVLISLVGKISNYESIGSIDLFYKGANCSS